MCVGLIIKVLLRFLTLDFLNVCMKRCTSDMQDKNDKAKLPIKWMAIEGTNDGIFTEKIDVVH